MPTPSTRTTAWPTSRSTFKRSPILTSAGQPRCPCARIASPDFGATQTPSTISAPNAKPVITLRPTLPPIRLNHVPHADAAHTKMHAVPANARPARQACIRLTSVKQHVQNVRPVIIKLARARPPVNSVKLGVLPTKSGKSIAKDVRPAPFHKVEPPARPPPPPPVKTAPPANIKTPMVAKLVTHAPPGVTHHNRARTNVRPAKPVHTRRIPAKQPVQPARQAFSRKPLAEPTHVTPVRVASIRI